MKICLQPFTVLDQHKFIYASILNSDVNVKKHLRGSEVLLWDNDTEEVRR